MNYSMRQYAFVISALLISVSAIDLNTPAQARPKRDFTAYGRAFNEAYSAMTQCINQGNRKECSRLAEIKGTLANWCSQQERDACITYKNVIYMEGMVQSAKTTNDITNIP
jgi:hypothetical protein